MFKACPFFFVFFFVFLFLVILPQVGSVCIKDHSVPKEDFIMFCFDSINMETF